MSDIKFPKIQEQAVMWGYCRDFHNADRYKAIVDGGTGKLFSIVSKDYKVIRHEQAADELENLICGNEDLGRPTVSTSFYNDGGRMCRTYRFEKVTVEIAAKDLIHPELRLYNSYDVSWPLMVILAAYRLVCKNGMVVEETLFRFRKRHVIELEQMDFKKDVATVLKRFETQVENWRKWEMQFLSLDNYEKVMEAMKFGKMATEIIEDKVSEDVEGFLDEGYPEPTIWAFYNVLTWHITHNAASLNHRVQMEGRLRRALGYFEN